MSVLIDFAALCSAVPMERVLAAYGIQVQRGKALCPFHADHHPSMQVYPDGYYCFACGSGGDAVKFISRMEGIKNSAAAMRLSEIGGIAPTQADYRGRERVRRRAAEARSRARAREKRDAEYRALCRERLRLVDMKTNSVPLSEDWCAAARAGTN